MNDNVVLEVKNISKRFKIYSSPSKRLMEWATLSKQSFHKDHWAVKNVSFELQRGEFLGIIGLNGAGKSTLLKMISGILTPTEGSFAMKGKVLSILELSGGFDNRLTGRENVIRSAELFGFPKDYAETQMGQIAEFSELGEFFNLPLKLYSTGMRTRLSFSLFAYLECDVLILDEVLATGDVFFRQKCYARLDELVAMNTAIILVTHGMSIVNKYCSEVIVIHQGEKIFQGESAKAIATFMQLKNYRARKLIDISFDEEYADLESGAQSEALSTTSEDSFPWPQDSVFKQDTFPSLMGKKRASLRRLALCNADGSPAATFRQGEQAFFFYEFELKTDIGLPIAGIRITDEHNLLIHSKNSLQNGANAPLLAKRGSLIRFRQSLSLNLAPGIYIFELELLTITPSDYKLLEKLTTEEYRQKLMRVCRIPQAGSFMVMERHGEQIKVRHGGLCDLPGESQIQVLSSPKVNESLKSLEVKNER